MIEPIGSPSAFAALFTTMSTPPSWSTVVATSASSSSSWPAWVGTAIARPPAASISAATCCARVGLAARDDDRGAGGGERLGDRAADAAAPAGDDRDPTGEVVARLELLAGPHRHEAHVTRLLESLRCAATGERGGVSGARPAASRSARRASASPRPTGRVDRRHVRRVLGRVGLIQIDSVNVIVRSQELPLFARLGPHRRDLLAGMVEDGELFEYWGHEASLLPIELFPLLRWRMEAAGAKAAGWSGLIRLAHERPDYVEAVYEEVRERGLDVGVRARRPGREVRAVVGLAARQAGARVPVLERPALGPSARRASSASTT